MAAALVWLSFVLMVCTGVIATMILRSTQTMSTAFDRLASTVTSIENVVESAIAVIDGLSTHLRAVASQPGGPTEAAINALADDLDAHRVSLAEAVVEGTTAENDIDTATTQPPPPPPVPVDPAPGSDAGPDTSSSTLSGGQADDSLNPANDSLTATASGNDTLGGGQADDTISAGGGADTTG